MNFFKKQGVAITITIILIVAALLMLPVSSASGTMPPALTSTGMLSSPRYSVSCRSPV